MPTQSEQSVYYVTLCGLIRWLQTTFLLALPLVCGMVVAARAPDLAASIRKRTTVLGVSVLVGVIVYGIAYFFPVLFPVLSVLGMIVLVHNALAFATGAAAGAPAAACRLMYWSKCIMRKN